MQTVGKIAMRRVIFAKQPPAGGKVLRSFTRPESRVAYEMPLADVPASGVWPEPTDTLDVIFVPKSNQTQWAKVGATFLDAPNHPDAMPARILRHAGDVVHWRPGRAVVFGNPNTFETWLLGLVEFAFYEGEIRRFDQDVETFETSAAGDVALSYKIRAKDRRNWPRIREAIEALSRLRLRFARLEPRCYLAPARNLPRLSRKLVATLFDRTEAEDRMGALSDRLEACETLYEGANDRIADFQWYRNGHILELGILVFLIFEVFLMLIELYFRYQEHLELMGF